MAGPIWKGRRDQRVGAPSFFSMGEEEVRQAADRAGPVRRLTQHQLEGQDDGGVEGGKDGQANPEMGPGKRLMGQRQD